MMGVPPIGIDFKRPGGRASRAGPLLLVAGALAAVVVFAAHRTLSADVRTREAQVEEIRSMQQRTRPALRAQDSDTPELREQIKKANAVLAQMNLPWGALFSAIESAQNAEVGLLSVQPDPRNRAVLIGGQGKALPAVFAYMTRLQQGGRLRDVVLVSHETKVKEPGQPVEFTLSAHWVETP